MADQSSPVQVGNTMQTAQPVYVVGGELGSSPQQPGALTQGGYSATTRRLNFTAGQRLAVDHNTAVSSAPFTGAKEICISPSVPVFVTLAPNVAARDGHSLYLPGIPHYIQIPEGAVVSALGAEGAGGVNIIPVA